MRGLAARLLAGLGPDAGLTLVGGALRDRLLGRPSQDWDLATPLLPQELLRRAKGAGIRAIPTGLQHGTVTLLVDGEPVEITTFRGDGEYLDGRRPQRVELGVALEEDLARRDFTINAMALALEDLYREDWRERVVDPFDGRGDLERGLIRAVGDPLRRFGEDGLRALRACRFASQLGFQVEAATLAAIPRRLEVASKVAVERVFQEMEKLLRGGQPGRGLELMREGGLLALWMPELLPLVDCPPNRHHAYATWEHTLHVVEAAPVDSAQRWASLLHDLGKPGTLSRDARGEIHYYGHERLSCRLAQAILERLKAPKALESRVLALVRHHNTHPGPEWGAPACRRFLRALGEDGLGLEDWGALKKADIAGKGVRVEEGQAGLEAILVRLREIGSAAPPLRIQDLALGGRELMALAGRPGGPWLGALQKELLEAVLERPERNTPRGLGEVAVAWLGRGGEAGGGG